MKYIRIIFPFIITLFIWRLAVPFWNPAGALCLIPIFYYTFIQKKNWFAPFATLVCFLLDYTGGTLLFWTSLYLLTYAINGFQNTIDLTRAPRDGLFIFLTFIAFAILFLSVLYFSFMGILHNIWFVFWAGVLYIPFVAIAKRIGND